MSDARSALCRLIDDELDQDVGPDIARLSERIRADHDGVAAVLFYGSGLWKPPSDDTVFDFYVIVDGYRDFDARRLHALFGWLLPPNVYFLEHEGLRCKFAVMREDQFCKAARGRFLTTQIWARFSQPVRLAHVRDNGVRARLVAALADAVLTFHAQTLPLLGQGERRAENIWIRGLGLTYGNEWRSEDTRRAATLFEASREALEARSAHALEEYRPARRPATRGLRRVLGKAVYFVQLMKAAFTFDGGVDYALWKIERQSGVRLRATELQRRHPLLAAWPLVWRAWKQGALR